MLNKHDWAAPLFSPSRGKQIQVENQVEIHVEVQVENFSLSDLRDHRKLLFGSNLEGLCYNFFMIHFIGKNVEWRL